MEGGGPTEKPVPDRKGLLNQDGERRIRNALFALAFDDSAALEKLAESPDDNSRNITGAMTMVAARLASINKEITKGNLYNLNITDEIGQAADILQSLRTREYRWRTTWPSRNCLPTLTRWWPTFSRSFPGSPGPG
jgi:hypothetical protein